MAMESICTALAVRTTEIPRNREYHHFCIREPDPTTDVYVFRGNFTDENMAHLNGLDRHDVLFFDPGKGLLDELLSQPRPRTDAEAFKNGSCGQRATS